MNRLIISYMCINICTCTYIHVYTYKQTCHIYPYIYILPHNYLFVDYTHSSPGEKKALQLGNWNRGSLALTGSREEKCVHCVDGPFSGQGTLAWEEPPDCPSGSSSALCWPEAPSGCPELQGGLSQGEPGWTQPLSLKWRFLPPGMRYLSSWWRSTEAHSWTSHSPFQRRNPVQN